MSLPTVLPPVSQSPPSRLGHSLSLWHSFRTAKSKGWPTDQGKTQAVGIHEEELVAIREARDTERCGPCRREVSLTVFKDKRKDGQVVCSSSPLAAEQEEMNLCRAQGGTLRQ